MNTVPISLIETALNSSNAAALLNGSGTHDAALRFVGEIVAFTQDSGWISAIVAGFLPANYSGNTLDEIPGMVSDSVKNGFASPVRKNTKEEKLSVAQQANLILSSSSMELFHTPEGIGFVAFTNQQGGIVCHSIRSDAVKNWVRLCFHRATGKTLGRDALTEVLDLLAAKAHYEGALSKVNVRIAGSEDEIYYDPGKADGTAVRVSTEGWELVKNAPVYFHRPAGFVEQVLPDGSRGRLSDLRGLLQLDDKNWVLLLAFLLISLKPAHPYMVLLLSGGHGSGKSKISELVKRIVDPNALEKSRLPKDEHTLAIQAAMTWMLVYDNTSSVRWDLSDAICAMLTGGGFSTRKFYADDEQRMFKNARPAIINGIGEFASQHDLLDRAIALKLPTMPAGARSTERDINRRFEEILPGVLAELFDIVSVALRRFGSVEPPTSVRMADAAQWLVAAEPATGLPEGTFLAALEDSVKEVTIENTINHPLVLALFKLLDNLGPERVYEGTVGDLHEKLQGQQDRYDPQLPKNAAHLSNALQRLTHGMAAIGLHVEMLPRTNKARPIRIWVEETEHTPEPDDMVQRLR
ncbi:hypothetical protein AVM02_00785 [Brucella anthropi]|uniref:hypothetical protein n=1 Tax=Brucella anthropi TaxID=529 RepID=UPI0039881AA9